MIGGFSWQKLMGRVRTSWLSGVYVTWLRSSGLDLKSEFSSKKSFNKLSGTKMFNYRSPCMGSFLQFLGELPGKENNISCLCSEKSRDKWSASRHWSWGMMKCLLYVVINILRNTRQQKQAKILKGNTLVYLPSSTIEIKMFWDGVNTQDHRFQHTES